MKSTLIVLAVAGALALATNAAAKGPSQAKITGKSLHGAIVFRGDSESNTNSGLGAFAEQVGYWPAVFRQQPDPMLATQPRNTLGPKLSVTYVVPGNQGRRLHQDVYPWAKPSPLSYMRPGQPIFGESTRGGWYRASPQLKTLLVEAGLPATPTGGSDGGGLSLPAVLAISIGLAALLIAAGSVLVFRRRPGTAEAT